MEQKELTNLVESGKTIAELSEHFDKGKSTVRHWLKKYGLKTTGKAGAKKTHEGVDGLKVCTKCEENKPIEEFRLRKDRPGSRQPHCMSCASSQVVDRQRHTKLTCVTYKGGKCQDCGYDDLASLGAFEFHHLEPEHKDFNLSHVKNRNFASVMTELDKCVLLCANCHVKRHLDMKMEGGFMNKIEGNTERFNEIRKQKLDFACGGDVKCSECGYNDCPSALIISYQDEDKKYYKFNRLKKNWPDDFKKALTRARIICKNCHRKG
jgi:transposase-like protein